MPGGCTVLVALFILGKLYVANAGDSREWRRAEGGHFVLCEGVCETSVIPARGKGSSERRELWTGREYYAYFGQSLSI